MSYFPTRPKTPEWTPEMYTAMGHAFSKAQWWVKIFTVVTGISAFFSLVSFNIVGVALSGMVLYGCWAAWKSLSMFEGARQASDIEEGLSQLNEYLKWQTISLMVGFGLLALGIALAALGLLLLFFLV